MTCLVAVSFVACSNDIPEAKVPSVVLNSFKTDFPNATQVDWDKVKGNYVAEFEVETVDHEVKFSADGKKIMQKKDLIEASLPATIITSIKTNFSAYVLEEIEEVIKEGVTYYQVELDTKGKPDKKMVFSADGRETTTLPYWD